MNDENGNGKHSRRMVQRDAHWVEWLTGGVSGLLVVVMIAWIAWQAVDEQGGTPELRVETGNTTKTANGYRVVFTVFNDGRRTAASVPVTAQLMESKTLVEEHEVTLDYVPAQSSTTGALLFDADPARYVLSVRASGYEDP